MIYYNGFNLMVDMILIGVTYLIATRSAWVRGYGEGEQDTIEYMDRYGQYYHDAERESDNDN